ncbi:Rho-GAP domain-containing protein [Entamoeba marina]
MSFFRSRKYFGEPLENIQRRKTGQYNHRLPSLVHLCGTYLSEPNHVKVEGIFRHSAETNKIEKVKKIINTKSVVGSKAVLIRAFDEDIHICTSVLKQFLVELPIPVIDHNNIPKLKRIVSSSNAQSLAYDLFSSLPQSSADLLAYLLIFLNYVTSFSAYNKMDAHGLAVCFTPALIRLNPNSEDYYSVDTFVSAIKILITQSKQLIPRSIYSVFCVAFATVPSMVSPQKQQKQQIQQTKVSPVPNIHTQEDILDYVCQDRQLFHRPQQWADMSYPQLMQEYMALKTATSCFYYNSYFKTGTWPDDNDCLNVLNTITELKEQ